MVSVMPPSSTPFLLLGLEPSFKVSLHAANVSSATKRDIIFSFPYLLYLFIHLMVYLDASYYCHNILYRYTSHNFYLRKGIFLFIGILLN